MVDVGVSVSGRSPAVPCRAPPPSAQFIASRIAVMSASTAPSVQAAYTESILVAGVRALLPPRGIAPDHQVPTY